MQQIIGPIQPEDAHPPSPYEVPTWRFRA